MLTITNTAVHGRYLATDGTPLTGHVDLIPSADSLLATTTDGNAVILPAPVRLHLTDGEVTGEVPSTDDPAWNPAGWQYIVTPVLTTAGGARMPHRSFRLLAPAGTPVDLATATPVMTANGTAIVRGEKGETGDKGQTGDQGPDHYESAVAAGYTGTPEEYFGEFRGPQGLTGERGLPGPEGPEGPVGGDSTVPGPVGDRGEQGLEGPTGRQGERGERGFKGEDGRSYHLAGGVKTEADLPATGELGECYVTEDLDNIYAWTPNGWTYIGTGIVRGPEGPEGPAGQQGERGEQGIQGSIGQQGIPGVGERGPRGEQGLGGPAGPRGEQGERGIPGEASDIAGPEGIQGDKGDRGDQGIQGVQGIQGDRGEKGDRGDQGIQGVPGERGTTGPQGDPGTAIRWIGKTPSRDQLPATGFRGDAYTAEDTGVTWIRTDNGWESMGSFRGERGLTGLTGPQGIPGVTGQRGEPGPMPASAVYVVKHGTLATAARPAGATLVMWIGIAEPLNATEDDEWRNTGEAA